MLIDYLQWQFVIGPTWLIRLLWNLERASLRFFSVTFMVRTWLAYWHKDAMAFTGGTLTKLATIIIWNTISRTIGFTIRTIIILSWLIVQIICLPLALAALTLFILWPLLVLVGLASGVSLLIV